MNVTKKHIRRRKNNFYEKRMCGDMIENRYTNENNKVEAMIMLVTPELAKKWLEKNTNNRKIRLKVVDSYARDMVNGRWTLNNDAITFDKDDVLTNGQHRLLAIIKSETSQYMAVMYGIEHNINMDRPVNRSVGDNLSIFSDLPEILTRRHCIGLSNFLRKLSNDNTYVEKSSYGTYDFIKENQDSLLGFFENIGVRNPNKGQRTKFNNVTVYSAFYLAYINGVDFELLKNMKHVMYTGEYLFKGYEADRFLPIVKLDRFLNFNIAGSASDRYEIFLRTMYAIKSVADGKNLRKPNKPITKIVYDFKYKGKKISECF